MGMFDTVRIHCPHCGNVEEIQTKAGPCELQEWDIEEAPLSVLDGFQGKRTCLKCDKVFLIRITHSVSIIRNPIFRRSREEEEDDYI